MNDNAKTILALDASSTHIGWCLAQGPRRVDGGVYKPRGAVDQRIAVIVEWMQQMLTTHAPNLVAIEEPAGDHHNRKTDRLLMRVCGCIEGLCHLSGSTVLYIHPMKVKATGFSKDDLRSVALLTGKPDIGPDEADAVGIWQASLLLDYEQKLTGGNDVRPHQHTKPGARPARGGLRNPVLPHRRR